MHSGHDAAPQRPPHVHARRVCRGAAAPTTGKIPQQTQGGEAGGSQTEGERTFHYVCGIISQISVRQLII